MTKRVVTATPPTVCPDCAEETGPLHIDVFEFGDEVGRDWVRAGWDITENELGTYCRNCRSEWLSEYGGKVYKVLTGKLLARMTV